MATVKIENILLPDEVIITKIFVIRGQKIMIDRDLAELYGVETRVLNQAVRRNQKRFPKDFMFQMTVQEMLDWKLGVVERFSMRNEGEISKLKNMVVYQQK